MWAGSGYWPGVGSPSVMHSGVRLCGVSGVFCLCSGLGLVDRSGP